jgi:ACS family hexuronate transporter-like MFS transporter
VPIATAPPSSDPPNRKQHSTFKIPRLRWVICALLFLGSMVNYIDRGTIAILAPHLQKLFAWSESDYGWIVFAFQFSYSIMMFLSGGFIDRLGTRVGYALAMAWWSMATMAHALARGVGSFIAARFMLGAGEAGNFPASIKAVAEWFPRKERALATGVFNSGTNIGAVIAYPFVGWLLAAWGWQAAFIGSGGLALLCTLLWVLIYRTPRDHPCITPSELELIERLDSNERNSTPSKTEWRHILEYRQTWGFTLAKFMTDPIWWFYIFWLPKYLTQARGFSMATMELFGSIPFIAAMIGSIAGGWLSGFLLHRGWSLNRARKTAMGVCAFCMPAGTIAVFSGSPWVALALISLATSAHQGWSANVFTLASDLFPKRDVGTVVGIGGGGGALGGMIIAPVAGYTLQWFHSYVPLFIIASVMHPLAFGVLQWLIPNIEPLDTLSQTRASHVRNTAHSPR